LFERAVICTDLSPSSESIVACAGALGVLGVREVVLAHVIDLQQHDGRASVVDADAVFARQAAAVEEAGIRVHIDTNVGYPPYAIEEIAEEHGAGLIVIGSHGKGLFVATFSGSVSSDLVRICKRPVLLAVLSALGSSDQSSLVCGRLLSRVLFPTDLTHLDDLALDYLLRLAPRGLGTVDLLHVVDSTAGNGIESRRGTAHERLAEMSDALLDAGASEVRVEVGVGSPDREAAKRAAGGDHTMIIMAPRCEESPDQPLGGVTHAVIKVATSPVLLIPPGCRS
jgi:nucleotide-binding universal stress UspA family protein